MFENNNSKAPRSENEVLVAKDLRKFYGPREALRGLSFSLKAGRILGFLGPNGAGKTTSIRILTTILEPDAGHFVVDGISSEYSNEIRRRIGVMPETFGLPKQMTGIEYVSFFGQLYGLSATDARKRGMALLEEVGLAHRAKSLTSTYSHGMRQRVAIARALVNDPAVMFLDEPTLGLDPRGQQELLGLIRQIVRERNAGVILCSHLLSEVESVCDDVIILSSGQIIASGTVSGVIGQTQARRGGTIQRSGLRIQVAPASVAEAQQVLAAVPNVLKVTPTSDDAGWLRVELMDQNDGIASEQPYLNNKMLEALIRAEIPILSFQPEGGRLQDVFLHLTAEAMK
jgi:ABC-2 type transport system ATP-binding protein